MVRVGRGRAVRDRVLGRRAIAIVVADAGDRGVQPPLRQPFGLSFA